METYSLVEQHQIGCLGDHCVCSSPKSQSSVFTACPAGRGAWCQCMNVNKMFQLEGRRCVCLPYTNQATSFWVDPGCGVVCHWERRHHRHAINMLTYQNMKECRKISWLFTTRKRILKGACAQWGQVSTQSWAWFSCALRTLSLPVWPERQRERRNAASVEDVFLRVGTQWIFNHPPLIPSFFPLTSRL